MRKIIQYLLLLFLLITPFAVLICLFVFCKNYPESFSIKEVPWFILPIIVQYILLKKIGISNIPTHKILAIGFIGLNILLFITLFTFNTIPVSDYKAIWDTAVLMANDQFNINNYSPKDYIYIYNWQLGISAFESLFIRLFGENFFIFKILNVLLINATIGVSYRLSRDMFGKITSHYTVLLFCSFYPVIITCSQFTNQHLAALLILSSLYLINKATKQSILLAGIIVAILNVIRPMGIIINLAYIICLIYFYVQNKNTKRFVISILLYFIPFYAVQKCFDVAFIKLEYADTSISKPKIPYFKFDKGLTGYNTPDLSPFEYNLEKYNQWQKNKIVNKIVENPQEVIIFIVNKMVRYLGLFDYKFENTYNHNSDIWQKYPIKFFYSFGWGQYVFLVLLAIIGVYKWSGKTDLDIFQIFFLGIISVYIFIEAFTSYRYESYPLLILYASFGCCYIFEKKNIYSKMVK